MFDFRKIKEIDLSKAECLKEEATYLFTDELTGKRMVAKLMAFYNDEEGEYLTKEFRKLVMLSGEPEIGTVFFLATAILNGEKRNCYVMEFIDGDTIDVYLGKNNPLNKEISVDMISQLASGLEKAHHYEITHSDLHERNVIVDRLGYIKLIDFLWNDYTTPYTDNAQQDLHHFKEVAKTIFDRAGFVMDSILRKVCNEATSFKGLKNKILMANKVAFDWEKIPEVSQGIISDMLLAWDANRMYNSVFGEQDIRVDETFIPELDNNEKKFGGGDMFQMLDAGRRLKIEAQLKKRFGAIFHPLKQAGLVTDWTVNVGNAGTTFDGPYIANYIINLSGKFYKWKRVSTELAFLKPTEKKGIFFNRIILAP